MQQFLKPAARATRAEIVAAEFFKKFLLTVNDAKAFLDPSLRRETSATFAGDFERTVRLRMDVRLPYGLRVSGLLAVIPKNWSRRRDLHSRGVTSAVYKTAAVAAEPRRRKSVRASLRRLLRLLKVVEHQGIAPCIPVWKTGVYLSTPMLGKQLEPPYVGCYVGLKLESRAGIAPACAVLRTAAWADRPTG